MRDLGLLGTPWALILFYSGLQVPFTTFLYVGFLRALPRDFEDAALIAIAGFVGEYVSDWNLIFAALVISVVPILVVYFALQRSIINGFTGGLKG
jgi:raffinose/stachyose/melibiose transport system permease protein